MRHFYGFSHTYGGNIINEGGTPIGRLFRFSSRVDRDEWVDDGPTPYITESGYREALKASEPVVRRTISSPVVRRYWNHDGYLSITETGYDFWEVEK